jgi:AhpD family alkylhydroperoxidase
MPSRSPRRTRPKPAPSSAPTTKAASAATPSVVTGGRGDTPVDDPRPKSDASTPPNRPGKAKRTLTPDNFLKTVANVMSSGPVLLESLVRPNISAALREKLFLAVTSVNDCRYCRWGHTHWAMAQGVPLEEVNQILSHQLESLEAKDPAEAAAILFAQHYAEQLDQFDPEAIENLRKYYSDAEVAEVLAYVRFITLANLTGNTVDAILDRAPCHGSTGGLFEGMVAAAAVPVALVMTQLAKIDMDKMRSRCHETGRDASLNAESKGDAS